ncbi:SLC1 [Candida jiufengensis]|uniref:SLC1 n=1 Tax=Candida jiufengensis TaxID=497108 RepID=UPI00222594A9|nr:SLC1 [Candida jiufengensis]KAI5953488.1 SLC1 [Candida jiufengensis]
MASTDFLTQVKFYLKSIIFGSLIAGCALYGVIASLILRLIGKVEYAQYTVARAFYYTFKFFLGVDIKIKNEHYLKDLPAIVISNHQSALDIHILGRIFQPGYTVTSKKSLKYVPFLGWFMALSGTFFLDRAKSTKAKKVLDGALASLRKEKRALFMFPEGTRSAYESLQLLPFKKGAFHLAKQAKIPIIPVVVSNTSTIFNSKNKIFNRGEINIEVLPPVSTAELETNEDVSKCCEDVRNDMLKVLKKNGFSTAPGVKPNEEYVPPENENPTDTEVEVISEETPLISGD